MKPKVVGHGVLFQISCAVCLWSLGLGWLLALSGCGAEWGGRQPVESPAAVAGDRSGAAGTEAAAVEGTDPEAPGSEPAAVGNEPPEGALNTVVWLSVDGMRPDYIDRGDTPTFDRLISQGAYTRRLVPPFPSLTFPAHLTKATGVLVNEHGVPGNSFYDARQRRVFRYPPFSAMVESEAIWFTAARQGIRVAALDWPMAHAQQGPIQTAYWHPQFDSQLTDRQRLEQLVQTWQQDADARPLQLLMTWIGDVDRVGHAHGPDSDEVIRAVEETDRLLEWLVDEIQRRWARTAQDDGHLYLFITTDHGMSPVHTLVNLAQLTELDEQRDDVTMVSSGNVANLHIDRLDSADRQQLIERVRRRLQQFDFAQVYLRDELPDRWGYRHQWRVGELVVVLPSGYTFSRDPTDVTMDALQSTGPRGMHGYDPQQDPNMLGLAVFSRWPEPLGGHEIEQIDARQLHPTLARLLGIDPAEAATAEPISLDAPIGIP